MSHRIVQKVLPNAENLQHWTKTAGPIIRDRFEQWSQKDEFSLFESMSELGVIVTLYVMVGPAFAMKHGDEIVPLVIRYAKVHKAMVHALPRWMSEAGRTLSCVEKRVGELINAEIEERLSNPNKYQDYKDYLQLMLTIGGEGYAPGTRSCVRKLT